MELYSLKPIVATSRFKSRRVDTLGELCSSHKDHRKIAIIQGPKGRTGIEK